TNLSDSPPTELNLMAPSWKAFSSFTFPSSKIPAEISLIISICKPKVSLSFSDFPTYTMEESVSVDLTNDKYTAGLSVVDVATNCARLAVKASSVVLSLPFWLFPQLANVDTKIVTAATFKIVLFICIFMFILLCTILKQFNKQNTNKLLYCTKASYKTSTGW